MRGGAEVSDGERIEADSRQAELFRGLGRRQGLLPKGIQYMADESSCVAMG